MNSVQVIGSSSDLRGRWNRISRNQVPCIGPLGFDLFVSPTMVVGDPPAAALAVAAGSQPAPTSKDIRIQPLDRTQEEKPFSCDNNNHITGQAILPDAINAILNKIQSCTVSILQTTQVQKTIMDATFKCCYALINRLHSQLHGSADSVTFPSHLPTTCRNRISPATDSSPCLHKFTNKKENNNKKANCHSFHHSPMSRSPMCHPLLVPITSCLTTCSLHKELSLHSTRPNHCHTHHKPIARLIVVRLWNLEMTSIPPTCLTLLPLFPNLLTRSGHRPSTLLIPKDSANNDPMTKLLLTVILSRPTHLQRQLHLNPQRASRRSVTQRR